MAQKCQSLVESILEYDHIVHQVICKEQKDLYYVFKYVKKNLMLIAAIQKLPTIYESELLVLFDRLHSKVQESANHCVAKKLSITCELTMTMREALTELNPPIMEKLDKIDCNDLEAGQKASDSCQIIEV